MSSFISYEIRLFTSREEGFIVRFFRILMQNQILYKRILEDI